MRSAKPVKISDPAVSSAARRLDEHTRTLERRLQDYWAAAGRVDKTLALVEAEVAARLVRAAAYELNLRLLPHGVPHDVDAELERRAHALPRARADHEARFGPVPMA
jgi:hypothetical protein